MWQQTGSSPGYGRGATMKLADRVKLRLAEMTAVSYTGLLLAILCIVAVAVFGVIPNQGLLAVNAFLSGCVWTLCLGILIVGGGRVPAGYYCATAMIAGGLTMSIPSIFAPQSPVDWGTTVSRLGLLVLVAQVVVDLVDRWQRERQQGARA